MVKRKQKYVVFLVDTTMASKSSSNRKLEKKKSIHCIIALKFTPAYFTNKLVFASLDINSIKDKVELLADHIKRNVNVLKSPHTKISNISCIRNFLVNAFSFLIHVRS